MKTMNILSLLIAFMTYSSYTFAHSDSAPAKCPGIEGVREMEDLAEDGKTVVIFTEHTPILTSFADGDNFHYFMMKTSEQTKLNPSFKISVLSKKNDVIKTYKFDKWKLYKHSKGHSIADFNFLDFVEEKLNGPFDVYINLPKEKKNKIPLKTVPYKLSIEISDSKGKNICRYNYEYGSSFH